MKHVLIAALILATASCVTAPIEFCPGYKPAHQLTDRLIESFNANVKLWPAGTTPKTDSLKAAGWDHSEWSDRRVIICSSTEVSMRAFVVHYREDGSKISREDHHYVFRRKDDGWAIAGKTRGAL